MLRLLIDKPAVFVKLKFPAFEQLQHQKIYSPATSFLNKQPPKNATFQLHRRFYTQKSKTLFIAPPPAEETKTFRILQASVQERSTLRRKMSNQFIGLTMLVTLSSPRGAQLRGIVDSIEPGKSLTLRNGKKSFIPSLTRDTS